MPDDLTIVAQYAKSSGPPGKVYNAASRLLDSAALIDGFLAVVSPELEQLRDERDALEATLERVTALRDDWRHGRAPVAAEELTAALEKGAESHGDGS